jgi:hypothetical protein
MPGESLLSYIWNFHVISNLLLIYICKLHWNRKREKGNHLNRADDNFNLRDSAGIFNAFADWFMLGPRYSLLPHFPLLLKIATNTGKLLLIYICNFHVLTHLHMICICKLHWNLNTMFVCQVYFLLIYICNLHVLTHLHMIYICKLHWNLNTMFVCQVNYFWFTYIISMF